MRGTTPEHADAAVAPPAPVAPAPVNEGVVIAGESRSEILRNARRVLSEGGLDQLLIELCCSDASQLTASVPARAAGLRVTQKVDLAHFATARVIKDIIKLAAKRNVRALVWASVPRDVTTASPLIENAVKLCRFVHQQGGHFCWEWPQRNDLWGDPRVYALINDCDADACTVVSSAVGLKFKMNGQDVFVRQNWTIFSTDVGINAALTPKTVDDEAANKHFVECRGRFAKGSANYPKEFAKLVWAGRCPPGLAAAAVPAPVAPEPQAPSTPAASCTQAGHRERDMLPRKPLWCSLVTRVVKPKSQEAQCDAAKVALKTELDNMRGKGVWDESDVHSLHDLLKDPKISEAMLGRAFAILGIKGEELEADHKQWKARIVFQGSNVRTKTGTSAVDLFEEVSNSPASFAAARAALGVAALRGLGATVRDAEAAFLQALMDMPTRVPTYVELPREWWPDSWFHDGAERQQPKYVRPHCRLKRALYGHPEAGALWEKRLVTIMKAEGWAPVSMNPGVFTHAATGAVMIVYVDDMLLLARAADAAAIWAGLDKKVKFKDPAADIERYLGARYRLDKFNPKEPGAPRRLDVDMDDYVRSAVSKFKAELGRSLPKVTSPFLASEDWAREGVAPGAFAPSCASHVATLLFLSRVARPDVAVAVQRLCTVVSRWTTTHDAALVRLFAYLECAGPMALRAELSPEDLDDLVLNMWSDADWNGDAEDTKSTAGCLLELYSPKSGRRWPIAWSVRKQTASASSTAEAETVAVSYSARHDGLPMQELLDVLLGGCRPPLPMIMLVDNTQAISAVQKGYSKKLKHLNRSHRVSIGFLNELVTGALGDLYVDLEYAPTGSHRGDSFTKAMVPAKFAEAVKLIGMVSTRGRLHA